MRHSFFFLHFRLNAILCYFGAYWFTCLLIQYLFMILKIRFSGTYSSKILKKKGNVKNFFLQPINKFTKHKNFNKFEIQHA